MDDFVVRSVPVTGLRLVHRRYVSHAEAHYAGALASGAFVVGLFGDIATDVCVQLDGDEGLFASYSELTFHGPLFAGDVVEVNAEVIRVGNRSRTIRFEAHVVSRARPERGETASGVLRRPVLITNATGTVVVPVAGQDADGG